MNTLIHILTPIGLSLQVGLVFFYKALWSILFGVAVTAAIDVFVDKARMARFLGGRDVKTTGLATALGAASSACTFGAVTIAQTLFKKGASAEASLAFALASTNIVFELAILIYVLLGPAFVAAELLSGVVLVPQVVWTTLFVRPVSVLGVLENAALGVLAGIFSFIGSIGIVPFAAALWIGGAGFAGVLGCIVSDNITVPVLNVWRNFYGATATAYIFAVFYAAMVAASVLLTYLFGALGWIPSQHRTAAALLTVHVRVDYTLVLTLLFLGLTTALWLVKRVGDRRGVEAEPEVPASRPVRQEVAHR